MIEIRLFFTLLLVLSGSLVCVQRVHAEETLEELMQGFDDGPDTVQHPSDIATGDDLDVLLSGFDDASNSKFENQKPRSCDCSDQTWQYSGYTSISSSYNYAHKKPGKGLDYRGLSRLRFKIQPEVKLNLAQLWNFVISGSTFYDAAYTINEKNSYPQTVLDNYESETELRELYVFGRLTPWFDVKLGRQIVVWGKSDTLRVVDVLNPVDNREPGMVDIEALRLPITMSKFDFYTGPWNLSFILVHELLFNKNPPPGSDFFPADRPTFTEVIPSNENSLTEFAFAFNGTFSGFDLSYHWARFYDDAIYLEKVGSSPFDLFMKHAFIEMFGITSSIAYGSWVIKSELAHFDGIKYLSLQNKTKSRVDIMAGIDYSGFTNTNLSLEVVQRHLLEFNSTLKNSAEQPDEDVIQGVFRYTGSFQREKLHITFLATVLGQSGNEGGMFRLSADYELAAGLILTAGGIAYYAGVNSLFKSFADNDRVFSELRLSF